MLDHNPDLEVVRAGHGDRPALTGSYDYWKEMVRTAVRQDWSPTRELVEANEMLAAWESSLGIARVSSFPVQISLNITDICNARCSFCAYVPERVSGAKVTLDQLRRADWLRFSKIFTPNGGGLGEPLAHPQIDDILELIRSIAPFIRTSIITNGSIMRDRFIAAATGFVDIIKVSLNAATEKTYEATMPPLKWDTTINNVRRLADAKIAHSTDLPLLRAGYVLHAHNVDELPSFAEVAKNAGFDEIFVNVMSPPPPSSSRELMTAKDSVFNNPEAAQRALNALAVECQRLNLSVCGALPIVADLGSETPVPQKSTRDRFLASVRISKKPTFSHAPLIRADNASMLVSQEWLNQMNRGHDPMCWHPWRTLKVDIRSVTKVCCNYAHSMPEFDWPTGKEFHRDAGMWNHPFMQHMRKTMGTENELPFCTFCKTSDKRDVRNTEIKAEAKLATQRIYEDICLSHRARKKKVGILDQIEDLMSWGVDVGETKVQIWEPFKLGHDSYRHLVASRGFGALGRVLQLGCTRSVHAPFLAEWGDEVIVAEATENRLKKLRMMTDALELTNIAYVQTEADSLPFKSSYFDGVWLDGRWLEDVSWSTALQEIARVLRPGGRLYARGCKGPGAVVEQFRAGDLGLSALRDGPSALRPGSFVDLLSLEDFLEPHGLRVDQKLPPAATFLGNQETRGGAGRRDYAVLCDHLDEYGVRSGALGRDPRLAGLEKTLSFLAIASAD